MTNLIASALLVGILFEVLRIKNAWTVQYDICKAIDICMITNGNVTGNWPMGLHYEHLTYMKIDENISERKIIDKTKNKHQQELTEFLNES